jgi:hypothetical protein
MMRVRKFLKLSRLERWLLVKAFLGLAVIQFGLHFFTFQKLKRLLNRWSGGSVVSSASQRPEVEQISRAVRVASYYIPDTTCLPQALVAHFLLLRNGYPAELKIGAAKNRDGKLEAHAWVTSGEMIVIGALRDLDRYAPLTATEKKG